MVIQWALPLGFIGLLGIGALILIYVLKPRYQNRVITSTYVWRLSLKYRKKSAPIDLFGHLLAFCVQALILIALALILAKPLLMSKDAKSKSSERIIIVDASASMYARLVDESLGETRFERAINEIKKSMDDVLFDRDGVISVILANDEPEYIVSTLGKNQYSDIVQALDAAKCSYGQCNMETALLMAQERLALNPLAQVYVYSGTEYGTLGNAVTTVNLSNTDKEWNIAILNCNAVLEGNEYVFYVDVAAYGNVSTRRILTVQIKGADNGDGPMNLPALEIPVTFNVTEDSLETDSLQRLAVRATDTTIGGDADWYFSSYEEAVVEFRDLTDSIEEDNSVKVYGGVKDEINIQYYSSDRNIFFYLGFQVLKNSLKKNRNINLDEISKGEEDVTVATEGYDFYIFEHELPDELTTNGLPDDGVVILFDPNQSINGLGIQFNGSVDLPKFTYLTAGDAHPLTQFVNPDRIGVSKYTRVRAMEDSGFEELLYCGNDPLMLVKNTPTSKIVVLPFSLNQSNLPYDRVFETILYNLINYFMPYTITESQFELGDSVTLNCKGTSITVQSGSGNITALQSFPEQFTFTELGTYTFTTSFDMNKKSEVRKAYVKPCASESNIFRLSDLEMRLDNSEASGNLGQDIFFWISLVIVTLLFVEWWLQFRKTNV